MESKEQTPHSLEIAFTMGKYGWALMTVSLNGKSVKIACSDVYSPFKDILEWGKALDSATIPAPLAIDEESKTTVLEVSGTDMPDISYLTIHDQYENKI